MNGLELSRGFYEEYGAPMLHEQFPQYEEVLAIGLAGSGSECFGYDDEVSRDHDFEPGFCIFLPDEEVVDRRTEFLLDEFFSARLGRKDAFTSDMEWFGISEQYLAEVTNGEVFRDDVGLFSSIREKLRYLPHDVRCKKLAGNLLLMAQSGQYNYERCLAHGETAAAQLAISEYVRHTLAAVFLLNRKYLPYYKWQFRALKTLPYLSELSPLMEELLTTGNDPDAAKRKSILIENIAGAVITQLQEQNLTEAICGDLEKHAYSVNDRIVDGDLRNRHILFGVD